MAPANHTTPGERPARPGETCTCGRAATIAFITERFGTVPYCGSAHPEPPADGEPLDALSRAELLRLIGRNLEVAQRAVSIIDARDAS